MEYMLTIVSKTPPQYEQQSASLTTITCRTPVYLTISSVFVLALTFTLIEKQLLKCSFTSIFFSSLQILCYSIIGNESSLFESSSNFSRVSLKTKRAVFWERCLFVLFTVWLISLIPIIQFIASDILVTTTKVGRKP